MPRLYPNLFCLALTVVVGPGLARADDVYFSMQVRDLNFTAGERPTDEDLSYTYQQWWDRPSRRYPYASLAGEGDAYVITPGLPNHNTANAMLYVRAPAGKDVRGRLIWPDAKAEKMSLYEFTIPASKGTNSGDQRRKFLEARLADYQRLVDSDLPGAAWFRHQANAALRDLGRTESVAGTQRRFFGRRGTNLEDTLALVSGGRALAENLQLDRVLPEAQLAEETVSLDTIEGISVREFDWKPLVKDIDPKLDPLARLIPDDQHALFFRSFQDMVRLADEAAKHGIPILQLAEPRAEDARTRERYEHQLGLALDQATRLLAPALIQSVVLTGADPYLRTGTDLALVFEAPQPDALRQALVAKIQLAAGGHSGVQPDNGEIDGIAYRGMRSPDRTVSSYVAQLDSAVVVTNSTAQLRRIVQTHLGKSSALVALDEYRFFRHRYPIDGDGDTALLVISDKTIRRWCGPRWRIATSRRTRAMAVMADLQAQHLDELVKETVHEGPVYAGQVEALTGKMVLAPNGVRSSLQGTLAFQTPIVEIPMDRVTRQEAELYATWRDGYQRQWSNFFDPIAVQFTTSDDRVAADLTVMPLIAGSEYRQLIAVSQGAKLAPHAGDPHLDTLLHVALALNHQSETLQGYGRMLQSFGTQLRVDPLSWMGDAVAVYVDHDDKLFEELAQAPGDKEDFLMKNVSRLPIALYFEVKNGFKLAAFLTGIRAFAEQASPGMTIWETRQQGDQAYVRVGPSPAALSGSREGFEDIAIYYVATGDMLLVTLSEPLLLRSLDRRAAMAAGDVASIEKLPKWLGENLAVRADRRVIELLDAIGGDNYQKRMQQAAWDNVPILNEWKQRYRDKDPVALHERLWQRRLICPGGGEYRWNDAWQTMESSVYSHPADPKAGRGLPGVLRTIQRGEFGVTLEENGIRAAAKLERTSPAGAAGAGALRSAQKPQKD